MRMTFAFLSVDIYFINKKIGNSDNMPFVVSTVLFTYIINIKLSLLIWLLWYLLEKQAFMSQTNWSYWVKDINLLTNQPMRVMCEDLKVREKKRANAQSTKNQIWPKSVQISHWTDLDSLNCNMFQKAILDNTTLVSVVFGLTHGC